MHVMMAAAASKPVKLTINSLSGWIDDRQVVTWTSPNHQIKWSPSLHLIRNIRTSGIKMSKELHRTNALTCTRVLAYRQITIKNLYFVKYF